jgi:transcriptional regulator with XRE-family HTH domain
MERPTDYTERMSSSTIAQAARTGFSYLLRRWRSGRRMSQLDLALEAAVSARHISFLESGRAQPSREMVLKLANALQVPFREQNILLQAAGFASVFRETSLDAAEMANVRRALELILRAHEPFRALAMTRYWDAVMVNRPQAALLTHLLNRPIPPLTILSPPRPNVLRLLFEAAELRSLLVNWETVARVVLHRVHREALWARDEGLAALAHELGTCLPSPSSVSDVPAEVSSVVIPMEVRSGSEVLRFFSTITTLGAPQDITLQELRVEAFFPADDRTEQRVLEDYAALQDR